MRKKIPDTKHRLYFQLLTERQQSMKTTYRTDDAVAIVVAGIARSGFGELQRSRAPLLGATANIFPIFPIFPVSAQQRKSEAVDSAVILGMQE